MKIPQKYTIKTNYITLKNTPNTTKKLIHPRPLLLHSQQQKI